MADYSVAMKKFTLIIGLMWVGAMVQAQTVYKVIQPDGTVEFTDAPPEGEAAQKIEVPPLNTTPPLVSPRDAFDDQPRAPAQPVYSRVRITSPENHTAFWDTSGTVNVDLSVTPSLRPGDKIEVMLDGRSVGGGRSTAIALTEMNRGTHTVQALIKDASGKVLARSNAVSFTLHKGSRLSPQRRPEVAPHRRR